MITHIFKKVQQIQYFLKFFVFVQPCIAKNKKNILHILIFEFHNISTINLQKKSSANAEPLFPIVVLINREVKERLG